MHTVVENLWKWKLQCVVMSLTCALGNTFKVQEHVRRLQLSDKLYHRRCDDRGWAILFAHHKLNLIRLILCMFFSPTWFAGGMGLQFRRKHSLLA